jgi:pimeloyl-ACP methyl ester carboxylesterase
MAGDSIATIAVDGGRIAYHRRGSGRPLLVLNGLAATSADWEPSFIERLASANELILLDNRGIGASTDNGAPFDIDQLADDTARVIDGLGFERANVLGWSLGGFIAQTLALQHPARIDKLILLSTDPGGVDAELASPAVRSQLINTSGTPREQARRLLSLLFPGIRFPAFSPTLSTSSMAILWRLHGRNSLLISSAGRPPRWMRGIAMEMAVGFESCALPHSSLLAPRTSSSPLPTR